MEVYEVVLELDSLNESFEVVYEPVEEYEISFSENLTINTAIPSNYGLISYALGYIAFSNAICTLGITRVIVKELIENKKNQGVVLGTSIGLRLISSCLCMTIINLFVFFILYLIILLILVLNYHIFVNKNRNKPVYSAKTYGSAVVPEPFI